MSGFFEEVKRRKVYRVAAAYIIAAGFIIQIGSAVFPGLATYPGALCSKYSVIGVARKAAQDNAGARAAFLKAKGFAEARLKQSPEDASAHSQLAEALAWLGEKDAALAEAKHAAELLPESKDALDGPAITESLATIYTIFGDADRAIELLDGLLARPSSLTVHTLKLNPIWDPLRKDPRFQALIDKYSAKA